MTTEYDSYGDRHEFEPVASGNKVDLNTQARLKSLCRALEIPFDNDLIADPEAHFPTFGQLCCVVERWKEKHALLQAVNREVAPEALPADAPVAPPVADSVQQTDAEIIALMKKHGIEWSEGGRGEWGYSIGSFDRMSMDEARAILKTVRGE